VSRDPSPRERRIMMVERAAGHRRKRTQGVIALLDRSTFIVDPLLETLHGARLLRRHSRLSPANAGHDIRPAASAALHRRLMSI
jgi:hypothetical protein